MHVQKVERKIRWQTIFDGFSMCKKEGIYIFQGSGGNKQENRFITMLVDTCHKASKQSIWVKNIQIMVVSRAEHTSWNSKMFLHMKLHMKN